MEITLDHISYAVTSTDKSIDAFSSMYPVVEIYKCHDKNQNIYITYLSNSLDNHKIELIEPSDGPSPVDSMLTEHDSVLYHLCYRVSDFEQAMCHYTSRGFIVVTPAFVPADDSNVWASHLYNESVGLIEIIGKKLGV